MRSPAPSSSPPWPSPSSRSPSSWGAAVLDGSRAAELVSRLRRRRPARPLRSVVRRLGAHGPEPCIGPQLWCTARCTWSRGSPPACGRWPECPLTTEPGGVLLPLLGLSAVAVLRTRSRRPLPASFWSALAVLLSFWLLTAASFAPGREPDAGEIPVRRRGLLLLVLASFGGDPVTSVSSPSRACGRVPGDGRQPRVSSAITTSSPGFASARSVARWRLRGRRRSRPIQTSSSARANTKISPLDSLTGGPYLSAIHAFGSPAYSLSALREAPEDARVAPISSRQSEHLRLIPVRPLPAAGRSPPTTPTGAPRVLPCGEAA